MDSQDLAEHLTSFTLERLEALVERHLPDFELPRIYAGHPVGGDVRADLAFTLALLADAGVDQVANTSIDEALVRVLRPIDGQATHTFFSYRVAETVARYGPLAGNPLLDSFTSDEREQVALACDSTEWIPLLDGALPANYAGVLSRCELGRLALGLPADPSTLDDLLERVRALIGRNPFGYLEDSEDGRGARYDIYTADVYLFTEPFADRLGDGWDHGVRHALALVEAVAARTGAAISWGRSTGVLASCLTLELAALVHVQGLGRDRALWLGLAEAAREHLDGWFADDGVITAHQYRSPYHYRGPDRRLQMTLDCLGKLAWSAGQLRAAGGDRDRDEADRPILVAAPPPDERFPERDELLRFEDDRPVGVWSYRSRDLAFVLPLVGPTRSDYLPAPRNPTLFEVPVDSGLATGVPVAHSGGRAFTGAGIPTEATHRPGRLELTYDGFDEVQTARSEDRTLPGRRRVAIDVDGRTLRGEEDLQFDESPDVVSFQIAETLHRPLHVEFASATPHRVDTIDTSGLKEYRSFWAELPRVHQLDIDPARDVRFRWSVTPKLRIGSGQVGHHYHRSLYDPLVDRVHERSMSRADVDDPRRSADRFPYLDVFHLHWPEWFIGTDVADAERFVDVLDRHQVRLLWTQHNRRPHFEAPGAEDVYQLLATRADAVIHHSEWGRAEMERTYTYGSHTLHRVIPHGHWGDLASAAAPSRSAARATAETELGLEPCRIRIGIVGAPRAAKHTQRFMEAFTRCGRDDLQLVVLSLDADEQVPDDPRIRAWPYEFVPRERYDQRLASLDVIALPFDSDGQMLTTGVVGDVVGRGLPALISAWPYLTEVLGDAAIRYTDPDEDLVGVLEGLDEEMLAEAGAGARALQERYSWTSIAEQHWALLTEIGTAKL